MVEGLLSGNGLVGIKKYGSRTSARDFYPLGSIMLLNIWTTAPTLCFYISPGCRIFPKNFMKQPRLMAQRIKTFWYVVRPQLRNITFLVVTMGLISTLQMLTSGTIGDRRLWMR